MKLCERHRHALMDQLEEQGFPKRSWDALFKAEELIAANAIDHNPSIINREVCPICELPLIGTRTEWLRKAAMSIWMVYEEAAREINQRLSKPT
jgi:hypothetical protein